MITKRIFMGAIGFLGTLPWMTKSTLATPAVIIPPLPGQGWRRQDFEVNLLLDSVQTPIAPPHDWRQWPEGERLAVEAAVRCKIAELPAGSIIVHDRSRVDMRADLSALPWQLYRAIIVDTPPA